METTAVLELRAGEGGTDSCLFLRDMTRIKKSFRPEDIMKGGLERIYGELGK